ncbi:MAG: ATP-binding protein [candidate division Zixibacteria bacterium]|nr:ATP-binding protein [candidate division Zixibacteria bacterium]
MEIRAAKLRTVDLPREVSVKVLGVFENEILDMIDEKPDLIAVDCSGLEQVTSSHINALWLAYLYCKEAGVEISIASPSEGLIRVLKLMDLHDLFMFDHDTIKTRMRKAVRSISSEYTSTYADEFMADVDNINLAMVRFLEFIKVYGLTEIAEFELKTVFYEVATNIRNHSGITDKELIVFTARKNESKITMVFADSGKPFDISGFQIGFNPHQAGLSKQKRGFGLELIHRLLSTIDYKRLDNVINVLTLEKELE